MTVTLAENNTVGVNVFPLGVCALAFLYHRLAVEAPGVTRITGNSAYGFNRSANLGILVIVGIVCAVLGFAYVADSAGYTGRLAACMGFTIELGSAGADVEVTVIIRVDKAVGINMIELVDR